MPIQAQTIIDNMRRVGLDAEGSDYYTDAEDLIPAINSSIQWLVSVINTGFAKNKLSEETFRELVKVKVFQASDFSRVSIDPAVIGHDVWTILAVYPKPTTNQSTSAVPCAGTNIYTDGDDGTMEADITGLSTRSGDAIIKSSDQAFAGSFSTKFTAGSHNVIQGDPANDPGFVSMLKSDNGVDIVEGLVYTYSAQVYFPSASASDADTTDRNNTLFNLFQIKPFIDVSLNQGAISTQIIKDWKLFGGDPQDEWVEISMKVTANKTTTIFPEIQQGLFIDTAGGIVYVDNVEFKCATDPEDSFYISGESFLSSEYSAKRLTSEEWNENRGNPFSAGNTIQDPATCPEIASYAYKNFTDYTSTSYNITVPREIEIRPNIKDERVAIEYLKVPDLVLTAGDTIEFPASFEHLIYQKALNFVSFKQGDNTTINSVTNADLNLLVQSIL